MMIDTEIVRKIEELTTKADKIIDDHIIKLNDHIAQCDKNEKEKRDLDLSFRVMLEKLSTEVEIHMKDEEKTAELRLEESKERTKTLQLITEKLTKIEEEITMQPSIIRENSHDLKDSMYKHIHENYVTKKDMENQIAIVNNNVDSEIQSIKDRFKYIYMGIAIFAGTVSWLYTNVLHRT